MAERGGLPWYRIYTEFSRHPKTLDLCARVKDRNAGMYVIRLWEHCADQALDGRIAAHSIEELAAWRGKAGVLLSALESAGWVEAEGDARVVHGWDERNGSHIRKVLRDAQKPRGNKPQSRTGPARDGEGTSAESARVDRDGDGERDKPSEKPAAAARERAKPRRKSSPAAAQPASPATEAQPEQAAPEPAEEVPTTTTAVPPVGAIATDSNPTTSPASGRPAEPTARKPEAGRRVRGPVIDDDIPPRPLVSYDMIEGLGPLGQEFQEAIEERIRRPLAGPKAERREAVGTELEQLLASHGVAQAVDFVVTVINSREGSGAPLLNSITGALFILRSKAAAGTDLLASQRKSCPEWAKVLEEIRKVSPGDGGLHPGQFESLFVPLQGRLDGRQLIVTAPDEWHRSTVVDVFATFIRRAVHRFIGEDVEIEFVAPAAVAAGGAP